MKLSQKLQMDVASNQTKPYRTKPNSFSNGWDKLLYIFIGLTIIEVKTSFYSKEEKKAEKEKEKQVRKIFSLFTDYVDDFIEVNIKEKLMKFLSLNLFYTGCIQKEKVWEVKCKELRESDQSPQVLINQLINFYPEVSKKMTKANNKFLLSMLSTIYLFYCLIIFFL